MVMGSVGWGVFFEIVKVKSKWAVETTILQECRYLTIQQTPMATFYEVFSTTSMHGKYSVVNIMQLKHLSR